MKKIKLCKEHILIHPYTGIGPKAVEILRLQSEIVAVLSSRFGLEDRLEDNHFKMYPTNFISIEELMETNRNQLYKLACIAEFLGKGRGLERMYDWRHYIADWLVEFKTKPNPHVIIQNSQYYTRVSSEKMRRLVDANFMDVL